MIDIKTIPVGTAQSNCYILTDLDHAEALIIDPGDNADLIRSAIEKANTTPLAILLTHTHFDHIGAVDVIRDTYEIPVYVGKEEADWLLDPNKNLSTLSGGYVHARAAEHLFNPVETLEIGHFTFKVVPTPGHSPGSVSFIFEDGEFVVSGDALFAGSIGRTDLPEGNHEQLLESIRQELFTLSEDFTIYPGHGKNSTVGYEKATNPFF